MLTILLLKLTVFFYILEAMGSHSFGFGFLK